MTDSPYLFCRNRDLGTISVYIGYCYVRCLSPPLQTYGKYIYIVRLLTPHTLRGVIISEPKRPLGVIFDEDHDFKGPRAPKAHLDTVLTKPVTPFRGGMIHVFSQHTHRGGPGAPGARRGPPTLGHFRHFNYILIGRSFRRKTTDTTHNPAIICFRMHDAVCAAPLAAPEHVPLTG